MKKKNRGMEIWFPKITGLINRGFRIQAPSLSSKTELNHGNAMNTWALAPNCSSFSGEMWTFSYLITGFIVSLRCMRPQKQSEKKAWPKITAWLLTGEQDQEVWNWGGGVLSPGGKFCKWCFWVGSGRRVQKRLFWSTSMAAGGTGRGTQVSPWASEFLKQDSLSAHPCSPSLTLLGSRSCHLLLLVAGPHFLGADRREAPLPAGDIAFILALESLGITTLASEYNITTFF